MFLLCAEDSVRLKVLLQQLIVASHTKKSSSNFLHLWAIEIDKLEQNPSVKWQDKSLEALCIIQEKLIITKLGLDFFDLDERFHASKVNSAVFIHPIAKLLYFICDKLTINEAMLLIKRITTDYASTEKFNYTDNGDHLELYLMHWIALDVISIGQNDREACNLAPIVRFLKEIEKEELTDVVKAIGERFNAKRAHQKSKIRTDDRRITEMTERSGNLTNVKSTREMLKSDAYKISKESAGILLIINQKNFHRENAFVNLLSEQPLRYRDGTEQDAKALKQTFKRFNYRIIEHDDVPHYEILTTVRDAVNQCHKLDSIIICILSHGAEGIIYGSDSVGVHIDDIKKTILVDSLIGKPKILIIQACQGDEMQQAKKVKILDLIERSTSCSCFAFLFRFNTTVRNQVFQRTVIFYCAFQLFLGTNRFVTLNLVRGTFKRCAQKSVNWRSENILQIF